MATETRDSGQIVMDHVHYFSGNGRDAKGKRVNEHSRKTFEEVEAATKAILNALNGGSQKPAIFGFLAGLMGEHRYLQNEGVIALLTGLGVFGGMPRRYTDARNEIAHKLCGTLREALNERIYWEGYER
jgi:hypothetical protein